jgi:hypothetical protein
VEKHGRFQQQVELSQIGRGVFPRPGANAGEDAFNTGIGGRRAEDKLKDIPEAEGDRVVFLQNPPGGSFAIHEDAEAVSAVFDVVASAFVGNCGALAGDSRVGDGKVVFHFSAANIKRRLVERHHAARTVRGNYLNHCFAKCGNVNHKRQGRIL